MTTPPLIKSISSPRLSSYKNIFSCTDDESCFPYYLWNQQLSSELYVLMSNIEICLRNKIHIVLSEEVSLKFTETIESNFSWYDHFSFIEVDRHGNRVLDRHGNEIFTETGKAFRKITHNRGRNLNRLPQIIISKLEFGKWSYVLSAKKYNDGDLIDWNTLFPLIFPSFTGMDSSKHQGIIERIRVVRSWRNRLAHLEPVWKFKDIKEAVTGRVLVRAPRNQAEVIRRLNAEIRRALELLLWLCPETHTHYKASDSYKKLLFWASHEGISKFL
jgi:hypothetical protein